ncbi:hypothetical protein SFC65_19220 [Priestia filamentosa]|uniref:hypothetical protein n=1 Tax=Priestia filamentosa TaxID=1402861 RepID=UPI0039820D6C
MEENKKVCLLIAMGGSSLLASQFIGNEVVSAGGILIGAAVNATALVLALKNYKKQKAVQPTT